MKRSSALLALPLLLAFGAAAHAACVYPQPPQALPNGSQATKDEMVVRFGKVIPKKQAKRLIVDSVDFQPEDRISHIVVRTDQTNPVVNMMQKNGDVVIDVSKAALAAGQQRTQDPAALRLSGDPTV